MTCGSLGISIDSGYNLLAKDFGNFCNTIYGQARLLSPFINNFSDYNLIKGIPRSASDFEYHTSYYIPFQPPDCLFYVGQLSPSPGHSSAADETLCWSNVSHRKLLTNELERAHSCLCSDLEPRSPPSGNLDCI